MTSVRRLYLEARRFNSKGLLCYQMAFNKGLLRTLNLKAYTISIAELRRSVEAPDEAVRVTPLLEREERVDAQKLRLSGVDLEAFYRRNFKRQNSILSLKILAFSKNIFY